MLIWLKNQGKVRYRTFQLRPPPSAEEAREDAERQELAKTLGQLKEQVATLEVQVNATREATEALEKEEGGDPNRAPPALDEEPLGAEGDIAEAGTKIAQERKIPLDPDQPQDGLSDSEDEKKDALPARTSALLEELAQVRADRDRELKEILDLQQKNKDRVERLYALEEDIAENKMYAGYLAGCLRLC